MSLKRGSGVLLHPTSLPGPFGSGDLGADAFRFVDWLESAGQSCWQMLPIGGIGPGNSPYMSPSAFAGNPLLVDLAELQQRGWLAAEDLGAAPPFEARRVDYAAVHAFRVLCLRRAAQRFFLAQNPADDADFEQFCSVHGVWLDDYSLFMALADDLDWKDWPGWPAPLARREPAALREAEQQHRPAVRFWKFVQWCFFRQWLALKTYANLHGVQIIGDIPIFIAFQSAEVWARPDLFELDADGLPSVVAGVPPDYFSETGQRWGNPLYRWPAHADGAYEWWIARVRHATALCDIVRIDHFRGFAGYWAIPANEPTAVHGAWCTGPGAALFEAIEGALGGLPIIAEDLGVLTDDVIILRDRFAMPGMRILQFAFGGDAGNSFLPHRFVENTVVYTGTHDNDTSAGWWASASDHERAFVLAYLGVPAGASDARPFAIHWALMNLASASVAALAIHPLQDILGLGSECRMNHPGKASGFWEWRFGWDQLGEDEARRLHAMSVAHGRCVFKVPALSV